VSHAEAQIKLVIDASDLDAARSAVGFLGELLEPPPLAVTQFEAGASAHRVEAYFAELPDLADLTSALAALGHAGLSAPRVEVVPQTNWVAVSQAALPPVEAGRFVVHGSHDAARVGRRSGAILIDAGEAFGTAHHATTQGCLAALDRFVRVVKPRTVLDLGCGSGVLAIAAARLLPRATILASDIDPIATEVAFGNIVANGARARIRVVTAVGLDHSALRAAAPYDLILANILAGPLIKLAPSLRRALANGGVVILSGLLCGQAADVTAAYRAQGFLTVERTDLVGWSTLVLRTTAARGRTGA
jgi:ribosomal protein L11 methyltransferase